MRSCLRALRWLPLLAVVCAITSTRAHAVPTIANAVALASNVDGRAVATGNSQIIFRANVDPAANQGLINLPWVNSPVAVVIEPFDNNTPEAGGQLVIPMTRYQGNEYVCYVNPDQYGMTPGPFTAYNEFDWAIVARDTGADGEFDNGVAASGVSQMRIIKSQHFELLPVGPDYLPDKRSIPGQLGNGLRVSPEDSTSPNDGGGAHFYTWRVRYRDGSGQGLPPQLMRRRSNFEWHDWRFDTTGTNQTLWNSPVLLVLVDPQGNPHYCPMEFDPEAPNNGVTWASTCTLDSVYTQTLLHPTGGSQFNTGVYFRFRMVPTQYVFNWGSLPGEGPFTTFGGPSQPDMLPAVPVGYEIGQTEVQARPLANQYVGYAGNDRYQNLPFGPLPPPFPFYTDTAGRAGQWKYYYIATTDLRPPQRAGFGNNGSRSTYPSDPFGADVDGYLSVIDSDVGQNPGSPDTAYLHPMVTPILSDGGWTDDLAENGYAGATSGNSHRSRPTTKTRVRFQVRVTKADNTPLPAQAVRVWIDGVARTMAPLPVAGNDDFITGIVFYYDTTFPPGQEGQHWTYFEVDDGIHKAIWPRRDTPENGTGDTRYYDIQAQFLPSRSNAVNFGTGQVFKNYLNEPRVNNKPVLSNPTVNPTSGVETQPYTYEVTYTDADGDAPLDAWVVIDTVPHRMTQVDDAPVTGGRRYRFVLTSLVPTPDGRHNYFFRFRDNWNNLVQYNISTIRREFGEWVTFPAGDDNGDPSSVVSGPIIVSNKRAQLTDPAVYFSDPAQTPATLWDFVIRYRDPDNDAPAFVRLYLSNDGGTTWDGGTALVKAESSNNYSTGVQYHLPTRVRLPFNATNDPNQPPYQYAYKFVASDGATHIDTFDDPTQSTRVHVGTGSDAITTGTARTLVPVGGTNTIYADPNNTRVWYQSTDPDPAIQAQQINAAYQVWVGDGPGLTLLTYPTDYTIDFANSQIVLVQPNTTGAIVRMSYYYEVTPGPTVNANRMPVLTTTGADPADNYGTLTPLQGSPTTDFTFTVVYTDPDNQAPEFVNLVLDTQTIVAMAMDPATSLPADFTRGIKYVVTRTGAQIGNGQHNYHFEASDGSDLARFPSATATPSELSGPSISSIGDLTLPPTGTIQNNPIVPFPKGKSTDSYVFTVVYKNAQGLAPVFPIDVRIKDTDGVGTTAVRLQPIDPIGPTEYQNGIRYQIALTAPAAPLTPGTHEVTFGFAGQGAGTNPLMLIVNGPPTLTNPMATPNPASQAGDVSLSVKYTDVNGDPPTAIRLLIDGTAKTETPTTVPANPSATDFQAGVVYTWTYAANLIPAGTHTYQFTATDDLEAASATVPQDFTINAPQVPTLLPIDASANGGTVTPLTGALARSYTYRVRYSHGDGVAPLTINVVVDPGANQVVHALTPVGGPPTEAQIRTGVVYEYVTAPSELASGQHTYKFEATDRLVSAALPATGVYTGPTVNAPPGLSNVTAFVKPAASGTATVVNNTLTPAVTGTVLDKFMFTAIYVDPDFVAGFPPTIKLTLDTGTEITMGPKTGDPLDYTAGVVYQTTGAGTSLPAGARTFRIDANDRLDTVSAPAAANQQIGGITVYNVPVLTAVNATGDDGTLSPRTGPLSGLYTYKVTYKHADGTAPQSVKVFIDGTAHDMTRVETAPNFITGATYQYQHRFPVGSVRDHNYRFEATDSVSTAYTVKFPVDGSTLAGPALNLPAFSNVAFAPSPGLVGSPVTVTGTLYPVLAGATGVAVQVVRPDGSGFNDNVTVNGSGNFTYQFTPNQTGDWKVRLSWAGVTGTWDALTADYPTNGGYKVQGYTLALPGGDLDFISVPLIPFTPDPTLALNPSRTGTGASVAVTALNVVWWSPTQARYVWLNSDGTFPGILPGMGLWVKPTEPGSSTPLNVTINPRGRVYDQTQPYPIMLNAGWNMIGSVYNDDTLWSAVQVRYNGQLLPLSQASNLVRPVAWTYNTATNGYQMVSGETAVLEAGRGYWVRALVDCELVLAAPGTRGVVLGRSAIDRANSLQVVARSGQRVDTDNYVPVDGMTADQVALTEKPPYMGDFVTVRFLNPDQVQLPAGTRGSDVREVVVFEVETDHANSDVTVEFPNAATLGRRHEITVVDLSTNAKRALGANGGFTYRTGEDAKTRRFAILLQGATQNSRLVITDLRTSGRAVGTTNFTYNLTATATVQARIMGASGQVVRDLAQGRAATRGVNSLAWDGKDSRGVAVPSGSYLLKVTATDANGRAASAVLPVTIVR